MPRKQLKCQLCLKNMRSDNLKRHMKIHEQEPKRRTLSGGSIKDKSKIQQNDDLKDLQDIPVLGEIIKPKSDDGLMLAKDKSEDEINTYYDQLMNIIKKGDNRELENLIKDYMKTEMKNEQFLLPKIEQLIKDFKDDERRELQYLINQVQQECIRNLAQTVTSYITKFDREEMREMLESVNDQTLTPLIEKYISTDYLANGELILPKIIQQIDRIKDMPKYKIYKLRMLMNDISDNKYRVKSILTRLSKVMEKETFDVILRSMLREELISWNQFSQLEEIGVSDLAAIAEIIKETKVGRGLLFLPRTNHGLRQMLYSMIDNSVNDSTKVYALVDELFRQKGISQRQYEEIKNELK